MRHNVRYLFFSAVSFSLARLLVPINEAADYQNNLLSELREDRQYEAINASQYKHSQLQKKDDGTSQTEANPS